LYQLVLFRKFGTRPKSKRKEYKEGKELKTTFGRQSF